jgi:hypothetical protein
MYAGPIAPCAQMSQFELLVDYVAQPINPNGTWFDILDILPSDQTVWVFANYEPAIKPPPPEPNNFLFASPYSYTTPSIELGAPGGWTGIVAHSGELVLLQQDWTPHIDSPDSVSSIETLVYKLSGESGELRLRIHEDASKVVALANDEMLLAGYSSGPIVSEGSDAGAPLDAGAGDTGGWLARYDQAGNLIWRFPDTGTSSFGGTFGVVQGADGSFFWLSNVYEGDNFYLQLYKISATGELVWSKRHDWFVNAGIAASPDGTVIVAGEAWPERLGIARYDSDGVLLYDEAINTGGTTNDIAIAMDVDGSAYIPWYLGNDSYIYKLNPDDTSCLYSVVKEQLAAQLVAEPDALYYAGERTVGKIPY